MKINKTLRELKERKKYVNISLKNKKEKIEELSNEKNFIENEIYKENIKNKKINNKRKRKNIIKYLIGTLITISIILLTRSFLITDNLLNYFKFNNTINNILLNLIRISAYTGISLGNYKITKAITNITNKKINNQKNKSDNKLNELKQQLKSKEKELQIESNDYMEYHEEINKINNIIDEYIEEIKNYTENPLVSLSNTGIDIIKALENDKDLSIPTPNKKVKILSRKKGQH